MKNHQKDDDDKTVEEFLKNQDYETLTKNLKDKEKKLLKKLGITTSEDLLNFLSMFGIKTDEKLGNLKSLFEKDSYPLDFISPDRDDEEEEDENYDDEEGDEDYDPGDIPKILFIEKDSLAKEYHIRIKLNNAPVKIWRELKVPSNMSLELLAQFLIIAMGWDNIHLHQFKKKDFIFKNSFNIKLEKEQFGSFWDGGHIRTYNADEIAISDVLMQKGERMKFEYDFGDSWEHDVWVKGIREYEKDEEPTVKFLKGQGKCPPEDCGGVWGYEELLAIKDKKRKSADEKEQLEWYGLDCPHFNPEECDEEWIDEDFEDYWNTIKKVMKEE